MPSKQEIIVEIKRTAAANGGKPLGAARFSRETGITEYEWVRHWPRFGEAQAEAGFAQNQLQGSYSSDFALEKIIALVRQRRRFPTFREIEAERAKDPAIPTKSVYQRMGGRATLIRKVLDFCAGREGLVDVAEMCEASLSTTASEPETAKMAKVELGEVYLFKSGKYFKIGRTKDTVRRGAELRIQLPETMTLVHSIRTDDPPGVEAYWHKRFAPKRMQGEWFDLSVDEITAFKRWRRIA